MSPGEESTRAFWDVLFCFIYFLFCFCFFFGFCFYVVVVVVVVVAFRVNQCNDLSPIRGKKYSNHCLLYNTFFTKVEVTLF